MGKMLAQLEQVWRSRLLQDCPEQNETERNSIVCWLLGADPSRWDRLTPPKLAIAESGINYRWQVLQQRYLGVSPTIAYGNLIDRLAAQAILRNKIRTWVSLSRDRTRAVADVLQEVIQELLKKERYIQEEIAWIARCTSELRLRDNLLLATLEEYCLRPIRNQPLIAYRFVDFLRRQERGGMTQVPVKEIVQMVSEAITVEDSESEISLIDRKAIATHEMLENWEETQTMRLLVQKEFQLYLATNVSEEAAQWLELYLQGLPRDIIASRLQMPLKQVYRLREKVAYHALKVFTLKTKPELVASWLEVSLQENNLGLTSKEWENYWQNLTPIQQTIVTKLKAGTTFDVIAAELNLKPNRVMREWSQIYLNAQAIRSAGSNSSHSPS